MDTVVHDGKEYKKLAVLAEEFGYTTDYIGQLCRAGKVDARLVGRAWYVLPESLKSHKKNRYQETFEKKLDDQKEVHATKNYERRVDVDVLRTNKTTKIHRDFQGNYRTVNISYESDQDSLIPTVKKPDPKPAPVTPAEATTITIKKSPGPKVTQLTPTELPEVYLTGKVPVAAVHERADLPVSEIKSPKPLVPAGNSVRTPVRKQSFKDRLERVEKAENIHVKPSHTGSSTVHVAARKAALVDSQPVQRPAPMPSENRPKRPTAEKTSNVFAPMVAKRRPKPRRGLIVLILLLAIMTASAVFGLQIDLVADAENTTTNWHWRWPS